MSHECQYDRINADRGRQRRARGVCKSELQTCRQLLPAFATTSDRTRIPISRGWPPG